MVRQTKRRAKFRSVSRRCISSRLIKSRRERSQIPDHVFEEPWRHLEQPVGLEPVEPGRPHVVQREDCADPPTKGRKARCAALK